MPSMIADAGSFRDPGGRVYASGERIFRAVLPLNAPAYEQARDAGLLDRLAADGSLVGLTEVDRSALGGEAGDAVHVLEHPRLPFISYPYEWSFSLLRAAALHQLDVHLAALEAGFTLSDATAYNIQFDGVRPTFIDHLSFRPYVDGELWIGHRQFCMQFLNPIIFWSKLGLAPNHWVRGNMEGIAPEDLSKLLPARHNLSWTILAHVTAQAAVHRRKTKQGLSGKVATDAKLSKTAFLAMLTQLRQFIDKARAPGGERVWSSYAGDNSYSEEGAELKRAFVADTVAAIQPAMLYDLGCNSGDYSFVALEAGAGRVIGFDYDFGALEIAFRRASEKGVPLTPLWLDAANPSPSQGWGQAERKGLKERGEADCLIALALIHHIIIGRNVPIEMALDWIVDMAPVGVIEFPPKSDPMVERLLASREDIFPDYTEENFLALIGRKARVAEQAHVSQGGRLLVRYDRR